MKSTKFFIFSIVLLAIVLVFAVQAQAGLQTIGTATYGGSDYNLIYDNDSQLTWLDYTNDLSNWNTQRNWAGGLNAAGVLTYNFNAGVSMNWSDEWRLPTVTDSGTPGCNFGYSGTDCGYNIDTSTGEMAHLWYDELDNVAYYDTSGTAPQTGWGLTKTGDFQNLQPDGYWSGTEYPPPPYGQRVELLHQWRYPGPRL